MLAVQLAAVLAKASVAGAMFCDGAGRGFGTGVAGCLRALVLPGSRPETSEEAFTLAAILHNRTILLEKTH